MTSVKSGEVLPDTMYIAEQNLNLVNEVKPYFRKQDDLYVIIAREIDYHNGMNNGNLRVGIIKLNDDNSYETILPFSKNLLYALFLGDKVKLVYVENKSLHTKEISFNSDRRLDYDDYAFLFKNDEVLTTMNSRSF